MLLGTNFARLVNVSCTTNGSEVTETGLLVVKEFVGRLLISHVVGDYGDAQLCRKARRQSDRESYQ